MSRITAINKIINIRKDIYDIKEWCVETSLPVNKVLGWLDDIQKELED